MGQLAGIFSASDAVGSARDDVQALLRARQGQDGGASSHKSSRRASQEGGAGGGGAAAAQGQGTGGSRRGSQSVGGETAGQQHLHLHQKNADLHHKPDLAHGEVVSAVEIKFGAVNVFDLN